MSVGNIGLKIKSSVAVPMYERFPLSDQVQTLPAGKPSPVITSYLQNGFYQLKNPEGIEPLYVKKKDWFQYVPPSAPDESSLVSSAWLGVADFFSNTSNQVAKKAGFLQEGFQKSVSDLQIGGLTLSKQIQTIGGIIIAILALYLIIKISD